MRYIWAFCVFLLLVGCGSGGSSSNETASPDPAPAPPPAESFTLSGVATGLTGSLIITNGSEELTVSDNGEFAFVETLGRGTIYDVRFVSLPNLQLCNLRNSRSFITRNRDDLRIECATMADIIVDLSDSTLVANTNKRLLSNYQGKGAIGEESIQGLEETIRAFNNTFVSVLDQNNRLIYSVFIDNVGKQVFKADSKSTAIAMLLLEPSIALGVLDRHLSPSQLESLIITLGTLTEVIELSTKIDNIVKQSGYLNLSVANIQQLTTPLNAALLRVAEQIVLLPVAELPVLSAGVGEQTGVLVQQVEENADNIEVLVENQYPRIVSAQSSQFPNEYLLQNEAFNFLIDKNDLVNSSMSVTLNGPGNLGAMRQSSQLNFINATVATGVEEYMLRGLNLLLGVVDPGSFVTTECIDNTALETLRTVTKNQLPSTQSLIAYQYQQAFRQVAKVARSNALSVTNGSSLIDKLFSCEKFGAGVFIDGTKSYAVTNVATHLALLNQLFLVEDAAIDLVGQEGLHQLGESIRSTYADVTWTISNQLALSVVVAPNTLDVDEIANYSGSCIDPQTSTPVTCEIEWDFGDGTRATGNNLQHSYSQAGDYFVVATAVGAAGATSSQELSLRVEARQPQIRIRNSQGLFINNGGVLADFSGVRLGELSTKNFTINNIGNADLLIDNVNLSNNLFVIDDVSQTPIIVAADTTLDLAVSFSAMSPGEKLTTVNVLSNDQAVQDYTLQLVGSALSQYEVESSSGDVEVFNVVEERTSINSDLSNGTITIGLYADPVENFPALVITLRNYYPTDSSGGEGDYSLSGADNFCLARFIKSADETGATFCTNSDHRDGNYGGSVNISPATDSYKLMRFEFVAAQHLDSCELNCSSVSIDGVVAVDENLFP